MHSNWIRLLSATLLLFFAFAPACDKAQSAHAGSRPPEAKVSQAALADSSRLNCKSTSEALDRLLLVFAEARKSGDKAKMHAALEQAESHIFGMKTEMSRCMNSMDMMGGMMAGKPAQVPKATHKH